MTERKKMTEEKKIPEHWQVKKLGDVCKLKNGYAFKSDKYENNGVPVIRISDINGGVVSSQKAVRVKANAEYENYLVENNDILVAMSGATTGKFGVYKSTEKAYQNQRVGKFKILDENVLKNEFLFHQINSLKRQIEKDAYGGAQPNISSTKIEQMQIVVPPLSEQQAIVTKIEELLSELENGKEQLLRAQQQLKVYRQSLLKWAFEGKLTNKSLKDGELPKGWTVTNLCALKEFSLYGPRFSSDDYSKDGIAVLRTSDISENGKVDWAKAPKLNLSSEEYEKYKLIKDDILITRTGSIGTISVFNDDKKAIAGAFLIYYRLKKPINIKYIFHFLKSHKAQSHFRNASKGVGRPNLNVPNIELLQIPLSTFAEQNKIIEELESKLTVCDKIEETISQSLQQAESLKQSILKKAFEGKLIPQEIKKKEKAAHAIS